MGLPVALFAFGEAGLQAAMVLSIITMGLHLTIGISLVNPHAHWRKVLTSPMIIATVLGLILNISHWPLPSLLATPIEMLGQVTIPLMLFALGVSLTTVNLEDWRIGFIGGILCPLTGVLALLMIAGLLNLPPVQLAVLVCFAVLPPAVMNYIFAEQYRQEPQKVASIVFLGNLLSLITLPIALAWGLSIMERV
jgi:predicted permease